MKVTVLFVQDTFTSSSIIYIGQCQSVVPFLTPYVTSLTLLSAFFFAFFSCFLCQATQRLDRKCS